MHKFDSSNPKSMNCAAEVAPQEAIAPAGGGARTKARRRRTAYNACHSRVGADRQGQLLAIVLDFGPPARRIKS